MKVILFILISCYTLISLNCAAQKTIQLSSPNGEISYSFTFIKGSPVYNVAFKGKKLIDDSPIGITFSDGAFVNNITALTPVYKDSTEDYALLVGKTGHVHDRFKEVTIPLLQASTKRRINLLVRAFNDGLAFRYQFLPYSNRDSTVITDENTTFNFTGNPLMRALFLPNYTSAHEGPYTILPLHNIQEGALADMPALFEFSNNVYVGVTEAALLDYAGMYLAKQNGILTGKLSPLLGQETVKVKASLPHKSPWRVLLISDRVGALIESNIITSLNEPCKMRDVSWIKPGKSTFPWWNGNVVPDSTFEPGLNFATNKYYIDFCARNNIAYHSVVEYGARPWYMDDGDNFQPGSHANVATPVPGLDMKQICDYGKKMGVGIRVWVHFYALYPKLDSAFAVYEKWGLDGLMVDFMNRDDQQMVNMQTEILQKAAEHHLHMQFHGAYKPTGLSRTYPNEFTREGTMNYEVNKWDKLVTPDHDINIPFTRLLAGSTDYHLGGFRAVPDSLFAVKYMRPVMMGTRCHMLAMYVILENALSMVCDYPSAYEGQAGFKFIQDVPTNWDETKVPDAKSGEYVVIARRHNKDWYIGGITNHSARQVTIPLNFLGNSNYEAEIYSDAPDVKRDPNHLVMKVRTVTKSDSITISMAGGGGTAIYLKSLDGL